MLLQYLLSAECVSGWAFLLSRKLRMMWRRLDSRVVAILSAEWVGGGVPVEPEASYAVASLRQSCCYTTYSVRSGRVGVPLEPEASYAVASF